MKNMYLCIICNFVSKHTYTKLPILPVDREEIQIIKALANPKVI